MGEGAGLARDFLIAETDGGSSTLPAELLTILSPDEEAVVARVAGSIRDGRVVALPTETVYGLAARADVPEVLARLAAVKGRADDKPFQRLLARVDDVACFAAPLGGAARILAAKFWPGPLTLVVPALVASGRPEEKEPCEMVGLRVPDHPVTQAILAAASVPVAATSANLAGEPPCLTAAEVMARLGGSVAMVVDAPPPPRGVASTVVEVRGDQWRILREGLLTRAEIEEALRTAQPT